MILLEDPPEEGVVDEERELRGAVLELLRRIALYDGEPKQWEVLVEGPAGTGKSRGIMEVLYALCYLKPGIRILVCRNTRRSLSESFCVPFEHDVCTPDEPFLGPRPGSRSSYEFENGSAIVLGGLDQPEKLFSTEYDIVYIQECFEIAETTWDKFYRAIRRFHTNLNVLIGDTNPRYGWHWLNKRCNRGRCERFTTTHKDNPKYFNADGTEKPVGTAYLDGLRKLTGNLYLWLYKGIWQGAEGLIYGNWSDKNWLPMPDFVPNTTRVNWASLGIDYFVLGADWGMVDAGVLQCWGICVDGRDGVPNRMILCAEIYRTGQLLDWWCERAVELYHEFGVAAPVQVMVGDPGRKDCIVAMNKRFSTEGVPGSRRGELPKFCIGADNSLTRSRQGDLSGLDLVRQLIGEQENVQPKLQVVRRCLRGVDPELEKASKPTCWGEEIEAYAYEQPKDGKPLAPGKSEQPAAACAGMDNSLDVGRYVANYAFSRDLSEHTEVAPYQPGTLGYDLRDWEVDGEDPDDTVEAMRRDTMRRFDEAMAEQERARAQEKKLP